MSKFIQVARTIDGQPVYVPTEVALPSLQLVTEIPSERLDLLRFVKSGRIERTCDESGPIIRVYEAA